MALKRAFVKDFLSYSTPSDVKFLGWISGKRHRGGIVFFDLRDSTGTIQAVAEKTKLPLEVFKEIIYIPLESCVEVKGILKSHPQKTREIMIQSFTMINRASKQLVPQPRGNINVLNPDMTEYLLNNRHIYLRNPQNMAILQFRNLVKKKFRQWFDDAGFIELDAPILTPVPLYDDRTAMQINVHGEKVFITQCVGYYLEAAAEAFEKVYNMGPSFRGEESRSRRHLMEYHHVKAEIAFGDLEDIMRLVEEMLSKVVVRCAEEAGSILKDIKTTLCLDAANIPYERITYRDAIRHLQKRGHAIEFGKSLGSEEEATLAELFSGPFWVVGPPRSTEPFPYIINKSDPETVNVADLIAPGGFGEILGTAEKIYDGKMLEERLQEKGKLGNPRYQWIQDLRSCGCAPHIAFGMGLERFIRWFIGLPHVRDAIPFPRIFRRKVYP